MTAWLSLLMSLLLGAAQVVLAVNGTAAFASCECTQCAQVQCCPCDSVPVQAPTSVPIRSSNHVDVQFLLNPAETAFLHLTAPDSATPLPNQQPAFLQPVHVYQRNCAYLI